ncbi:MAG: 4Fe-4S dicluster domain-containing protein [Thermodesulfobacteriota bacterium]
MPRSVIPKLPRSSQAGPPPALLDRRAFLRLGLVVTGTLCGGGILGLTTARPAQAAFRLHPAGPLGSHPYSPHHAMVVRLDRCIGCERCVEVCAATNNVPAYGFRIAVLARALQDTDQDRPREFLPTLCNHCNKPPCTRACPSKATYKDKKTGIVLVEGQRCIGCRACVAACPYNARYMKDETGTVDKCDFCFHSRLVRRKPVACAEACPAAALVFGDIKDSESEAHRLLHAPGQTIWVLRPELGTLPHVFYIRG